MYSCVYSGSRQQSPWKLELAALQTEYSLTDFSFNTLLSAWKQDLQRTCINRTVVPLIVEWLNMNEQCHMERQWTSSNTPIQTSNSLSAEDSKIGDKQSACSLDHQQLSQILQNESNSPAVPELVTGSSQAFLRQPYRDARPCQQKGQRQAWSQGIYASPLAAVTWGSFYIFPEGFFQKTVCLTAVCRLPSCSPKMEGEEKK